MDVKIKIYTITGQQIALILNKRIPAGVHQITFDGSDISSGIYCYRLEAGHRQDMKKMVLLR